MTVPSQSAETEGVLSKEVQFQSGEHKLNGKLFQPSKEPTAIVVLNGATGVPARFYEPFACWLAETKNLCCLIYDYRDFGASSHGHLQCSKATMTDWGVHDQDAAREFAHHAFPKSPLWVIGHSLGAMCLPFQRNLDQIDRVIAVASGIVNVKDHPWPYQALARLFWFGPVPLVTRLLRYLPGKAMRIGSDLPRGVYWQWRKWCTRQEFYARDFGRQLPFPDWTGLKAPTKLVAVADDVMTPPITVWRLMQCFPAAPKTQVVLRPGDFGLSKLGHIDVFSERNRAVWDQIIA